MPLTRPISHAAENAERYRQRDADRTVGRRRAGHHRAHRHRPGHRQVDVAEQDDQHHAGGDDAEKRRDLQLLQQIGRRQEARRIEAAEKQQQDDAGKRRDHRRIGASQELRHAACQALHRRVAHWNHSSRLRTLNSPNAPRLTANSSTTPWKSGCHSGSKSKTKSRSPMVRKASAPKIAPMALPLPP